VSRPLDLSACEASGELGCLAPAARCDGDIPFWTSNALTAPGIEGCSALFPPIGTVASDIDSSSVGLWENGLAGINGSPFTSTALPTPSEMTSSPQEEEIEVGISFLKTDASSRVGLRSIVDRVIVGRRELNDSAADRC
jgi:hypothetical protein